MTIIYHNKNVTKPKARIARQSGVVLIVVTMVVALLTIMLAAMMEDQQMLLRRTANQKVAEQAYQYAQGLNAWAASVLHEDKDRAVDYLGENWAKLGRKLDEEDEFEQADQSFSLQSSINNNNLRDSEDKMVTIDFGQEGLEVTIEDLQGKYNLNNLSSSNKAYVNQQKRVLLNLLGILEIGDFDERNQMVEGLIDWMDGNKERLANGFESIDYQASTVPYFASDQAMTSLGEIKYIKGFKAEYIRKLKPYVTILPIDNAGLNLNTVSAEVLSSISSTPVTDTSGVSLFLSQRDDPLFLGFQQNDIQHAETAIIQTSITGAPIVQGMMQVNSQFFQINSRVELGDFIVCLQSMVLREGGAASSDLSSAKVVEFGRASSSSCNSQEDSDDEFISET